jgi:cation diffusion facilitator family transporter
MQEQNKDIRDKNIKKVSIIGICANIFLLVIKGVIGFLSNSQAMIADSLNSAGDIFASFMSFIGAKISCKPCDNDHPYGHGKAEYVFSFVISLSMIIASIIMIKHSTESIILKKQVKFSFLLLIICIITIFVKFILFIYTNKKNKQTKSILISASCEDHRNDMFVTTGTLIGIISSYFGFYFIDGIVGILISLWIIFVGIKLLKESYIVLMDTSLDDNKCKEIIKIVEEDNYVLHVDNILSKPVGNRYIIILKVSMNGDMSLEKAHNIGGKIKEDLMNKYNFICDVIIHINPHTV